MQTSTLPLPTFSSVSVGLTLPSTSVYSTASTSQCSYNGVFGTALTAQTTQATPTTDGVTGAAFVALSDNQATVLVFGITSGGAIAMCQGSIVDTDVGVTTVAGAFRLAPQFPTLPDTICPVAYALVRTAPSASAFTPGTSNWTATGITTSTVVNISSLPDRPKTS